MTEFYNHLEIGLVKCRDIEKNVVTFFSLYLLSLCRDNENKCRKINLPFQIEFKIHYVATQRKYVATFY